MTWIIYKSFITNNNNFDNLKIPYIGYTCLDWSPEDEKLNDLSKEQRHSFHVYTVDEIKKTVHEQLEKLPTCQVFFRNKQCTKCGIIGDERFVDDPCHPKMKLGHRVEHPIPIHDGKQRKRHLNPTSMLFHDNLNYIHNKEVEYYHEKTSFEWYHPGLHKAHSKELKCETIENIFHPNDKIKNIHVGSIIEIEEPSTNEYYHPNLVWKHLNPNIIDVTNTSCICFTSIKQCYECCDGKIDSQGCQQICTICNQITVSNIEKGKKKQTDKKKKRIEIKFSIKKFFF